MSELLNLRLYQDICHVCLIILREPSGEGVVKDPLHPKSRINKGMWRGEGYFEEYTLERIERELSDSIVQYQYFHLKKILTISLNNDGFAYVEVYYELLNNRQEKKQMVGFGPNRWIMM